jgi:protein tyrosine/serine phosphatase
MIKTTFAALFAFLLIGCAQSEEKVVVKKEYYAKPVREVKLENFHKVDEKIYRSAQPSAEEFKALYDYGIRYELNLRQIHDDDEKLKGIDIKSHHIRVNTSEMSYDQLVEAVSYLVQTDDKTLVHCLHGSDRTGTVIAAYRIGVQGWSKEKAIDEFVNGGFGYHSFWFPNLPRLLESIDVEQFRKDIGVR